MEKCWFHVFNYITYVLIFCYNICMADYILARKTRNVASSAVHLLLNILFGLGSVMITVLTASPWLGLLLVLVSKWRVFAVRPRFLWLNIKSNLLDFIVGVSVVMLTYYSGATFSLVAVLLAIFYCAWLIVIKPMTSEAANLAQSIIAVFLGISATAIASAEYDSILAVVLSFIVGYSASRHILSQSNDKDYGLTTMVCGLIFAEITWLCHSWMIIYTFGETGIRIPQLAIILTIFAFVFNSARQAMLRHEEDLKLKEIAAPIAFGLVLTLIIIIWFSNPIFNI